MDPLRFLRYCREAPLHASGVHPGPRGQCRCQHGETPGIAQPAEPVGSTAAEKDARLIPGHELVACSAIKDYNSFLLSFLFHSYVSVNFAGSQDQLQKIDEQSKNSSIYVTYSKRGKGANSHIIFSSPGP